MSNKLADLDLDYDEIVEAFEHADYVRTYANPITAISDFRHKFGWSRGVSPVVFGAWAETFDPDADACNRVDVALLS